jgi:hypothetical protein
VHSHDYNPIEQFRQNVDHSHAFYKLFHPSSYDDNRLWMKLFLGIPLQVWQDWKFLQISEYFSGKKEWFKISTMVNSPFWQLATVSGGWLGAQLDHMPPALKRLLSRQERIKQS